jgi:hypothetical protein
MAATSKIAGGISLDDQPRLDAEDLRLRRDSDRRTGDHDLRCRERFNPNLVPYRREDAVQAAEDDHRTLHSSRPPACGRLQLREHLVETVDQAGHDMVGVEAPSVSCRDRRCPAADERRVGQDCLETRGCREKLFPVGELLDHR